MTDSKRTVQDDAVAELINALECNDFHRLRPDWLDIPLLSRNPDALSLATAVMELRRSRERR